MANIVTGLDDGWFFVYNQSESDYMKVNCQGWKYNESNSPEIEDLPGDSRYGYNLEKYSRKYTITTVYFDNHSDWDTFHQKLKDWNGNGLYLKVQRNSSGNFAALDADGNTKINVFYLKGSNFSKMYKGDSTFYQVGKIKFRQKG